MEQNDLIRVMTAANTAADVIGHDLDLLAAATRLGYLDELKAIRLRLRNLAGAAADTLHAARDARLGSPSGGTDV